jgi:hypothetical protein
MFKIREYPSIYVLAAVVLVTLTSVKFGSLTVFCDRPPNGLSDTSGIIISEDIKLAYPCIYKLLQAIIATNDSAKLVEGLSVFSGPNNGRLYFMDKELQKDRGAETQPGPSIDSDQEFADTIFLNSDFFNQASRDYLVSVIDHECYHVWFNWSHYCYNKNLHGVDSIFLKKHFTDSTWKMISSGLIFLHDRDHQLMSKAYITKMQQFIFLFTNPASAQQLRDSIARSFAWGGLHGTPTWKTLGADTCFMQSVDGFARSMTTVADKSQFKEGECVNDKSFFDRLALRSCQ